MLALVSILPVASLAAGPANVAFFSTWERTERPVLDRLAARTWMWGPEARTGAISEAYLEASDGYRQVQYFDKTRMEINDPNADPDSPWFVTNGLLATELITGRIQVGHLTHVQASPARIQVAGDPHPESPTYQTLSGLLDEPPLDPGSMIDTRLTREHDGHLLTRDADLQQRAIEAEYYVPQTDHTVAGPFWEFMTSTGVVRENGFNVRGPLFPDPFFATGYPVTEAYWVNVPIAGESQDVLLQCFQRRCLTYTPENPDGWQVEAGNIGLHYHEFRYGRGPDEIDCVDLNLATIDDLVTISNIGEARARDILEQRPFASVTDLSHVSGIGPVTVERIEEQGLACVVYDFDETSFYRP